MKHFYVSIVTLSILLYATNVLGEDLYVTKKGFPASVSESTCYRAIGYMIDKDWEALSNMRGVILLNGGDKVRLIKYKMIKDMVKVQAVGKDLVFWTSRQGIEKYSTSSSYKPDHSGISQAYNSKAYKEKGGGTVSEQTDKTKSKVCKGWCEIIKVQGDIVIAECDNNTIHVKPISVKYSSAGKTKTVEKGVMSSGKFMNANDHDWGSLKYGKGELVYYVQKGTEEKKPIMVEFLEIE